MSELDSLIPESCNCFDVDLAGQPGDYSRLVRYLSTGTASKLQCLKRVCVCVCISMLDGQGGGGCTKG